MQISYDAFKKVHLLTERVIKVEPFTKAKKPAYKVWVDFGAKHWILQTFAQITHLYTPESLINKTVIGCINIGEKNITGFISQFLLVGFSNNTGAIVLANTNAFVPNGKKLH